MIKKIREFFAEIRLSDPIDPGINEDAIAAHVQVATCVLLLEIACSDNHFSDAERNQIIEDLKRSFQLTREQAAELIELARQERKESADLWRFTNIVDNNYSREEKERVVESLWRVIYADKRLDNYEDHLIHRLSKLLNLSHKQLIDAKKKVIGWK